MLRTSALPCKDYLQGKADRDSIFVHPEPWYAEHAVDLSLGSAVTSLDPATGTVTTGATGLGSRPT
jgi:NAD(P)H-nitrite reductase large subunit